MITAPISNSFNYLIGRTLMDAVRLDRCPIRKGEVAISGNDPDRRLLVLLRDRLVLAETDTEDFTPQEIRGVRDDTCQVYLDVGSAPLLDDFSRDLRPLRPASTCSRCEARPPCPGAFRLCRLEHDLAESEASVNAVLTGWRGRVLDVGVGHPRSLASMLASAVPGSRTGLPFDYVGIEPDRDGVRALRQRFPAIRVVEAAAEDPGLASALGPPLFDHAMLLRSYNHLREPSVAIGNVLDLLRPGGTLLLVDNTSFGLLRSRRRMRALEELEEHGEAPFEHFRNHTSHDALRAHLGDLEVLSHHPVGPRTANQWVLHLRKPASGSVSTDTAAAG